MLFNSIEFLVFFPVVTALFFLFPHRARWALLLFASCVFYMAFIPKYLFILLLLIVIDYTAGLAIERSSGSARKAWLVLSVVSTVVVLSLFKYWSFLARNASATANLFGWHWHVPAFSWILPIGLSFHTFQSLSYVIEVYFGRQKAERHFGIYALYVMFYPQLVAGPIERPQHMLYQFRERHEFDPARVASGLKLMAWGMFKKIVVADRLALFVTPVYADPHAYGGATLAVATFFFAIQIFCDFSGYSDIALGAAEVMGFRLMKNFNRPYSATSVAEFWRRWHISLSTWFKDYVYVPLGGNRVAVPVWYRNLLVTFLLSGLWHGANWTFVIWGALHGFYLIFGHATRPWREAVVRSVGLDKSPRLHKALQQLTTFLLVFFAWIFFRANSLNDALLISSRIAAAPDWPSMIAWAGEKRYDFFLGLTGIAVVEFVHRLQRTGSIRERMGQWPAWLRLPVYATASVVLLLFGRYASHEFIYFQF